MKKLVMSDLLGKSLKELVALRQKTFKELFEYKLKNSIRALNQTHLLKLSRRNIARINTAIRQKNEQTS